MGRHGGVRTWVRAPLAILAGEDAAGGLVVEGERIVECLPAGGEPGAPCDRVFDASEHVVLPGSSTPTTTSTRP